MENIKTITFKVTEEEHKALRQYCLDKNQNLTTIFIRDILEPAELNWKNRRF